MNREIDYFNIKYIFIFLTIYFTLIPFLFNDITLNSIYTILVVMLGYISFLLGFSTHKRFNIKNITMQINRNKLFIAIGVIYLINDLILGLINLFAIININNYTENFEITSYDSLYLQILYLIFHYIKYYFYSLLLTKGKLIFYIIFISQVLLVYNSSTRLVALSPFIIFIIYGYYMSYIKITKLKIIIALIFTPFLFVILLLSRAKTEGLNYFQIIGNILDSLSIENFMNILKVALESFKSFEDLINIISTNFIYIESGLVRIIFMPISRSSWEDKPESISRIISKSFNFAQYSQGGGSVATIFGDAFINGHFFGVIIILFYLGFLSKIIYKTMVVNLNNNNKEQISIVIMMYVMFIYQFIFYFRGFFSEFYWKTILLIIVFTFLYKIQFRVKYINSKG